MRFVLLEDDERRVARMQEVVGAEWPDATILHFDAASALIAWLERDAGPIDAILLDHDLGPSRVTTDGERWEPGDGRDVSTHLASSAPRCPVLIHSTNSAAVPVMLDHLRSAGWTVRRVVPFSDLEWISANWLPELRGLLGGR